MHHGDTVLAGDALLGRRQLGPYRIEAVLGHGGMGVVFRARAADGTLVALKAIRPDMIRPARARFDRESAIRIEHPNVLRMLDAGTEDGVGYIAFELLLGRDLDRLIAATGPLPAPEVVRIMLDACAGLTAAHAAGVVHRDLKPANIFICEDGSVKILDFGIALVTEASRLTMEPGVLGTLAYLSPEQARGQGAIDLRSDLWSLGVVGYEALSGRLPFERSSAVATLIAVIQEEPEPLERVLPSVPRGLASIIARCLSRRADDRWQTAAALAEALRDVNRVVPASGSTPPRASLRTDEVRMVVVMLAHGVADASAIQREIEAHGGSAIPLLGRDVVGVFGAPVWTGDEAVRAATVAVRIRHLARRVSVASGRAQTGVTGLAGAALTSAQAACQLDVDGVAVDARTLSAFGSRFVMQDAADGFIELLAERGHDPDLADAEPPSLVGRTDELARLVRRIADARTGPAGLLLAGPAGIGKTRLRIEAERRILEATPDAVVLAARCEPLQRDSALGLFASALRRHARRGARARGWPPLTLDASPLGRRQAALALVREAIPDRDAASACAEFFGELLGVPWSESPAILEARRDAELMSDRLRLALVEYLKALVRQRAVALIFEDIQWADASSLTLLADLAALAPALPFFALLTARGDVVTPAGFERHRLVGVTREQTGVLAERAAGAPLPDARVTELHALTEGNPLFIEQIASGARGSDPTSELPFTVEAAVQARLDDLPGEARDACRMASIFGRPVQADELRGLGIARPEECVAELTQLELLEPQIGGGSLGALEYRFRSTLVADVAYRSIPKDMCTALHLRAAEHLRGRTGRDPAEVAAHLELGAAPELAAFAFAEAATEAGVRGDATRALRCSERSLALGVPDRVCFAMHMVRADTFRFLRRRAEQAVELEAALAVAATPGDRARVFTDQLTLASRAGDHALARTLAASAVHAADASRDLEARALARVRYAQALSLGATLDEVQPWITAAREIGAKGLRVRALVAEVAATAAASRGDVGEALEGWVEAVALYREAGDVRREAAMEGNVADSYNRVGAYDAASAALRKALAGCRRVGHRAYEGYVLLNLAYAEARRGQPADALAALAECEDLAVGGGDARLAAAVPIYRAHALVTGQRFAEALTEAERGHALAQAAGQRALEANADAVASRAALALDLVDVALARSERGLATRDELGTVAEDEADLFLARASALARAGRALEAMEVRTRGACRIREMATGISRPEWRDQFVRSVESHRLLLEASG